MTGNIMASYRTYLLTKSAITDLCSTRIYFTNRPQGTALPAVVLSMDDTETTRHMGGVSRLTRSEITCDVYAATDTAAYSLAEAIRANTETLNGTVGSDTVDATFVSSIQLATFPPADGSDEWIKGRTMQVSMWWQEPALSI